MLHTEEETEAASLEVRAVLLKHHYPIQGVVLKKLLAAWINEFPPEPRAHILRFTVNELERLVHNE